MQELELADKSEKGEQCVKLVKDCGIGVQNVQ